MRWLMLSAVALLCVRLIAAGEPRAAGDPPAPASRPASGAATTAASLPATSHTTAPATTTTSSTPPVVGSRVDVTAFGARGDGKTDDTGAFQTALSAVAEQGGVVFVPVGEYRINSHLEIPAGVTLEGVWKAPNSRALPHGSTLLAVDGAGSEEGPAFITLNSNSTLKGVTVFYPDQKAEKIVPYPWCVAGSGGENVAIIDCLLVNPYQAVDLGTRQSSRHYVRNLYGQPLRRGLFVDKCFDVGRIENVQFWPFWAWDEKSGIQTWQAQNGEAFIFARADWEYMSNCFCYGYKTAYHFIQSKDGQMSGSLVGIGADASHNAVVVEAAQPQGLLITNGQFVSFAGEKPTGVVVTEGNTGGVQFQNCAFWGPSYQIARIAGGGTVSFNNCNFVEWASAVPAIDLSGGNLLVSGCTFAKPYPQAILQGSAQSAVVVGNRFAGPQSIGNPAKAQLQAGLNVEKK